MKTYKKRWSSKGFTLVELMVVVTLIALLATLSTPTLSRSVQRGKAKDAAREVASALRNVRSQAMSRGQAALVRINPQRVAGGGDLMTIFAGLDVDGQPARSCEVISGIPTTGAVAVGTIPWSNVSPDMVMLGASQVPLGGLAVPAALGTAQTFVCVSPDGRVLGPNGQPITTTFGQCTPGFVVIMGRNPAIVEPAFAALTGTPPPAAVTCPSAPPFSDAQTIQRRTNRDLVDAHVVELTFNGAVEVTQ
jgi:prepilin-type N-terminal cleavage/methylation domain-containing protein